MEPNIPVGSEAGVDARHEARRRRRRARAARRRQRQVGRPLEDGPHRPAGLGEGRAGQSARTRVSRRSPTPQRRRRRPDAARAGAAHGSRRARSAERRAAVRQRVRPGHAGRRAQARRLLRQRRRALPDGGHGDRRDPPEHPVGVAAQERARSPTTTPATGVEGGRSVHAGAVRAAAATRNTTSCCSAGNRDVHDDSKTTTLPIAREIVETYVDGRASSCRGTSTCSTSTSATTISAKRSGASSG